MLNFVDMTLMQIVKPLLNDLAESLKAVEASSLTYIFIAGGHYFKNKKFKQVKACSRTTVLTVVPWSGLRCRQKHRTLARQGSLHRQAAELTPMRTLAALSVPTV